jgi:DNA-binding Lrp family transcriptional regulator
MAKGNLGPFISEAEHMVPKMGPAQPSLAESETALIPAGPNDADILWLFDLTSGAGIWSHDAAHSSILIHGDFLYINTGTGVDNTHKKIRTPEAPSLVVLDKRTGRLVARDRDEAHQFEQRVQLPGLGVGIFDELEAVGAHRIVGADGGGRRVVRKRTHGGKLPRLLEAVSAESGAMGVHTGSQQARIVHDMGIRRMTQVDTFDLKMLAALQDDGRLTNQELADQVGLSASQCSRRRMRLEQEKVIAGYHADLSGEALGFGLIAFVHITLATHSPDNAKKFRALVGRVDEIQEAYSLTGDADYVLKAVLRDLKGLSDLVNNVLMPHQSVAHVRSSIVLDRLKESSKLPLRA